MMTLESKEHLRNKVHSRLVRERKSAKEIQEVLDSLKARTLRYDEYRAMPQDIASWHEFANSANVDKALDAHKDAQKKAAGKIKNSVERMWTGAASTDESEQAWKTAEKFMEKYPQVRPTDSATGAAFRKYMRLNNLDPREFSSWETTLSALAATNQPEIFLSPKAAGIGPEEQLGGYSLRSYPNLYLLLRPAPTPEQAERIKASRMSADEWKKAHPELHEGTPFVIQQQFIKAAHSLASFEPEYVFSDENNAKILAELNKTRGQFNLAALRAAFHELKKRGELELKTVSVSGQVLTHTEYEPRESGQPEAPGKLAAKVRLMSSDEYLQFLRNNKSARAAIDGM
jgi:hypothetical protein